MENVALYFGHVGACCAWPMEAYRPDDLPPEDHVAIRARLVRDARRDGLGEDAAEEAGSQFYAEWLGRAWGRRGIPRGDHARAYYSIRAYARKSHWHGFTGERRQSRSKRIERGSDGLPVKRSVWKACQAYLAMRERLRERNYPLPSDPACAMDRLRFAPALRRKAERIARRHGMTLEAMVRVACGFAAE